MALRSALAAGCRAFFTDFGHGSAVDAADIDSSERAHVMKFLGRRLLLS